MWRHHYFLAAGMLAGSLILPTAAAAEVPDLIRYQGQLADAQGTPLEGPYDLTFQLYSTATGGTALWTEPHEDVALSGGQFSVLLGSATSLADEDWSQPRWLSIQVNTDVELSPRQQITSVPLAVRAGTAEALATPVTTSNITDDAHALVPAGAVILWTGASCPAGYNRITAMDGRFLVSDSAYNPAAGGANMHAHGPGSYRGPSHRHSGVTGVGTPPPGAGDGGISSNPVNHTHPFTTEHAGADPITGQSEVVDGRPAFATVLLCQRN